MHDMRQTEFDMHAARALALEISRQIVDGKVSPADGADRIYRELWLRLGEEKPDFLYPFVTGIDMLEDCRGADEDEADYCALIGKRAEKIIKDQAEKLVKEEENDRR